MAAPIQRGPGLWTFDWILRWDFDGIIMTDGEVVESGGREKFAAAFAYLS
jgi:hypothetical protein